jgi:hypothetical protein
MMAVMFLDASQEAGLRQVERTFASLGGQPVRIWDCVEARVRGLALRYQLCPNTQKTLGGTNCLVRLPREGPRIHMVLRPRTAVALNQLAHGGAIDLRVGDEAFDAAFMVEAVPSDLAKELLDECTRTALLTLRPCRVTIARGELRFMTNAFLDTPDQIAQVVELCVQTAMRLPALPADVRAKRLNETAKQVGYRGPDPEALHGVDPATLESTEVAAILEARARRRWSDAIFLATAFGIGTLAWIGIALVVHAGCQ